MARQPRLLSAVLAALIADPAGAAARPAPKSFLDWWRSQLVYGPPAPRRRGGRSSEARRQRAALRGRSVQEAIASAYRCASVHASHRPGSSWRSDLRRRPA